MTTSPLPERQAIVRRSEPSPPPAEQTIKPRRREVLAGPAVALITLVIALICTGAADVRFRDPDHVAAGYFVMVGAAVVLLVWLDIALRAQREPGRRWPTRAAMSAVRRTRWTRHRMLAAGGALLSFYVTYLAYRNLKGVIPLLRPGDLFDRELAEFDRAMFLGHDPPALLHDLLGTGISTHFLSTFYVAFIVFLPLSLAVALVFSRDLQTSLFYATALSLNWLIGAGSYFLLPALGPVYAYPEWFASLPHSEVTRLQGILLDDRIGFLKNPDTGTPQAIAAFASLHIAMSFTALAAAHLLDLGRRLKIGLWIWNVVTIIATVYLGWHYFVDDIAGVAIGALALALAQVLTKYDLRAARARAQLSR